MLKFAKYALYERISSLYCNIVFKTRNITNWENYIPNSGKLFNIEERIILVLKEYLRDDFRNIYIKGILFKIMIILYFNA